MGLKKMYCRKCGKYLPHTYIGKETGFEGDGVLRVFMAVCSLGASELPQHTFWKCSQCGDVKSN